MKNLDRAEENERFSIKKNKKCIKIKKLKKYHSKNNNDIENEQRPPKVRSKTVFEDHGGGSRGGVVQSWGSSFDTTFTKNSVFAQGVLQKWKTPKK